MLLNKCSVVFCVIFLVVVTSILANNIGDVCQLNRENTDGECALLKDCPQALKDIKHGLHPETCSFKGEEPVVCCEQIKKRIPGEISKQKCAEYAESMGTDSIQFDTCTSMDYSAVIAAAFPTEFPHMALIGFDEDGEKMWGCSGTLISDQFVMIAAHCLHLRRAGPPRWVRLGELDISSNKNDTQPEDFDVLEVIEHPDYKPPSGYNDIALVKLNKTVQFNRFIRPACLHTSAYVDTRAYIVTCYGYVGYRIGQYNTLQRIIYEHISEQQCTEIFESRAFRRTFEYGIEPDIQLCAGTSAFYKCHGESGSPLQVYNPKVNCMSRVIGFTTHGKPNKNTIIGIYTRVSGFIDWIEQIVWP